MAYNSWSKMTTKTKITCSSFYIEHARAVWLFSAPCMAGLDGSTITGLFNVVSHIHWVVGGAVCVCAPFWLGKFCSSSGFSLLSCDFSFSFTLHSLPGRRRSWTYLHKGWFPKNKNGNYMLCKYKGQKSYHVTSIALFLLMKSRSVQFSRRENVFPC